MKMKDSEVSWVGEIPENWSMVPFKSFLKKKKEILNHWKNQNILSLTMNGVIIRDLENPTGKMPATFDGYQTIDKGNFILCLFDIDVTPRCVGVANDDGVTSPAYSQYEVKYGVTQYYYYLLLMLDNDKILLTYSKTLRSTLTDEYFGAIKVPITQDISEQQKIADFLDTKVALIDQIIADTKRSIEELKAYKQSLITETVTKGLDPNVPMKDSGVEWIGEIPEGWELTKNKYLCDFNKGLSITKENLRESGVPVISYGQVHSKYPVHFDPTKDVLPFVSEDYLDYKNSQLKKGNFIFADTSEDYAGSGNFSMLTSNAQVLAGYHSIVVRLNKGKERLIPEYLAYYFASDMHRNQVRINVSGIKVFSITQQLLKNTLILIPPYEVQKDIVKFLEEKLLLMDELILNKYHLIKNCEIYKKSLIYEYVTGKKQVI